MTQDFAAIKTQLIKECQKLLANRKATIEASLKSVQESRDNEGKSSAGDKYETGRAMMHLEENKLNGQMQQLEQSITALSRVSQTKPSSSGQPGSLVMTTNGTYFIAIGLGKMTIDGNLYFIVSPDAPIGKALIHQVPGQIISFNTRTIEILGVY